MTTFCISHLNESTDVSNRGKNTLIKNTKQGYRTSDKEDTIIIKRFLTKNTTIICKYIKEFLLSLIMVNTFMHSVAYKTCIMWVKFTNCLDRS